MHTKYNDCMVIMLEIKKKKGQKMQGNNAAMIMAQIGKFKQNTHTKKKKNKSESSYVENVLETKFHYYYTITTLSSFNCHKHHVCNLRTEK